ncbi:MAG: hypothetical protein CMJ74_04805 [Planctomycetaceae bacterium]|nr:hypothetical protein [Planctomycetaceae bacterium]
MTSVRSLQAKKDDNALFFATNYRFHTGCTFAGGRFRQDRQNRESSPIFTDRNTRKSPINRV